MSLRITRRRQRQPDPLASPQAVRSLLDELRESMPDIIPKGEKHILHMLQAARHVERYPATDTRRGRPSRFERAHLLMVAAQLRLILDRETRGRISLSSFVDHYLRVLDFPEDLVEALSRGDINLFEAEQLARLSAERLGVTPAKARRTRTELVATHVQAKLSGSRLRQRVQELLGISGHNHEGAAGPEATIEDLEDFDPHDPTHLFFDEIRRLGFALKETRPEDLTDELLEEFLRASEPLWAVVAKIERRRQPTRQEKLEI